jgi:hypothetical protein
MSRLLLFAFISAVLFSNHSCTFVPGDEIVTEVEVPQPTPTTINFFQTQDTILVRGFVQLNLSSQSKDPIRAYKLLLDGQLVKGDEVLPSSVSMDSKKFSDGFHKISIVLTKQLKGESLASQLGLEFYDETLTRTIEIWNQPIVAPPLTADIEDGVLVLRWDAYTGRRFERYQVDCLSPYVYFDLTNRNQSSVQIPNFTGGKARFRLTLRAFNESDTTSVSYETFLNASIEKTSTSLIYKWSENPFTNSTGFKVTVDANGTHQELLFENKTTVYELPVSFEFPYDVSTSLTAVAGENDEVTLASRAFSTRQKIGGTNPQYYRYRQFIKHPTNDSLLLVHYTDGVSTSYEDGRIALYNRNSGKEINMLVGDIGISPNGKYIHYYDVSGLIVELDHTDLSKREGGVSFRDMTGSVDISMFNVSDDNKWRLCPFVLGAQNSFFFYDRQSRQLLFTAPVQNDFLYERIGSLENGGTKFYNENGDILLYDTNPFTRVKLTNSPSQLALSHRHQIVAAVMSGLAVYEYPSSTIVRQVGFNHQVVRMFANRENEFGVVYVHQNKVKIDFFDQRDLTLLTTLETQIPAAHVYQQVFSLVEDELFVYRYFNYANYPVHHTTIKFR